MKVKAPNPKNQITNNNQLRKFNDQNVFLFGTLAIGNLNLFGICYLDFFMAKAPNPRHQITNKSRPKRNDRKVFLFGSFVIVILNLFGI